MTKIRIGHLSTFYHTSILMIARGSFGDSAEWKLFGTGPAIVDAFERGELDIAYIGLPPTMIGIAKGVKMKCVAGGHIEGTVIAGSSRSRCYPALREIVEVLEQFQGQAVGVPGKGSIHDVILSNSLRTAGLSGRVRVLNYQWADQALEGFHRGEVSAVTGTPALAAAVKLYCDGKILFPPDRIWPFNPSYGIVASPDFMKESGDDLKAFLSAHEKTAEFIGSRTEEAADIIAGYVGVADREFIHETLSISPRYCSALPEDYIVSTMEFVPVLRKLGYIDRDLSVDEIFDRSLIDIVHPEKDHY